MGALKGRYGDHQKYQFKTRIQLIGDSLQEFTTAIEHLAKLTLVGLPEDFI